MKIPVLNIYYLLVYAWDTLEEGEIVQADAEQSTRLVDLFGRVLASGTAHLIRRGLDRGYVVRREELAGIRGRVDMATTVKTAALARARVACEFDELSHDVLHNRILKATLRGLLAVPELDTAVRIELHNVYRRMPEVTLVRMTRGHFRSVQLHRNNRFYRFILTVCRFVHEHLLVNEETGDAEFRDFVEDEHAMRRLFERFVRNFYRRHALALGFNVKVEKLPWQRVNGTREDKKFLPVLITDTSLISDDRHIVIETKFVPNALVPSAKGRSLKLRSAHLYQFFTYLMNLSAKNGGRRMEGILLYPAAAAALDLNFEMHGHSVRIRTLDLNQSWLQIETSLMALLDDQSNSTGMAENLGSLPMP